MSESILDSPLHFIGPWRPKLSFLPSQPLISLNKESVASSRGVVQVNEAKISMYTFGVYHRRIGPGPKEDAAVQKGSSGLKAQNH